MRIFITIVASVMFIMCATLLTVTTYTGSLFVAKIAATTFILDDVNILLTLSNAFQLSAIAFSACVCASLLFVLPVETYKVWKKD